MSTFPRRHQFPTTHASPLSILLKQTPCFHKTCDRAVYLNGALAKPYESYAGYGVPVDQLTTSHRTIERARLSQDLLFSPAILSDGNVSGPDVEGLHTIFCFAAMKAPFTRHNSPTAVRHRRPSKESGTCGYRNKSAGSERLAHVSRDCMSASRSVLEVWLSRTKELPGPLQDAPHFALALARVPYSILYITLCLGFEHTIYLAGDTESVHLCHEAYNLNL